MSTKAMMEKMGMLKWPAVIIGCLAVGTVTAMYLVGYQQQQAAIAFWGDQYKPHEGAGNIRIDWGFIGNVIIPKGGPIISTDVAQSCSDTPLPVVPMKVEPDGDLYLLCGIGARTYETLFDLNSVENEEIRNSLKDALKELNLSK